MDDWATALGLTEERANEILAAIKRQSDIDKAEAGPKAAFSELEYKGVLLESRWNVLSEYADMKRVVDAMPERVASVVQTIFCDSHCQAHYTVTIRIAKSSNVSGTEIESAFRVLGGYNGLMIYTDEGILPKEFQSYFDPWWNWGDDDLDEMKDATDSDRLDIDDEIAF